MTPLWKASKQFTESSNLYHFASYLKREKGLTFDDYHSLWQWSVNHVDSFWESIWNYYSVMAEGKYSKVLSFEKEMIGTKWFEGTRVNYAEHIFRNKNKDFPAIIFQSEHIPLKEISWDELEKSVAAVASYLKKQGVVKGDRVAAYLPNIPEALIAFLAVNSMGAVWSSCSPDFGTPSVLDRLSQIEPKILIACDGYSYNGKKLR